MSVRLATVQTLLFLFKFVTSETKESFVTRTNGSVVGALISIGKLDPYGRKSERKIYKERKQKSKQNRTVNYICRIFRFATQTFNGD